LKAFQDVNKVGQIQYQNMTSLSVLPTVKAGAWGSVDPVGSDGENFAGWDLPSSVYSILHLNFVQVLLVFTAFLDVYSIKYRLLFPVNQCVTNSSRSTK